MGDPLGAARHVREALAPDGTWMIVEPAAGDRVDGQPQPGRPGRTTRFSTFLCVPNGLSQPGGYALGCAGRRGGDPAGGHRRRVHPVPAGGETPFNLIYEVRP